MRKAVQSCAALRLHQTNCLPANQQHAFNHNYFGGRSKCQLLKLNEQVLCIDLAARRDVNRFDGRVLFGVNTGFHLHGFDRQQ